MQNRILHPGNMDDTTSEATSPYSASRMDSSSMYNQSNSTYQFHSQQQMTHSQATQDRFLQEASQQPRSRCLKDKRSEDERKARKRQADKKHRQKKKAKFDEMTSQNQHLQDRNRELSTENRKLKEEKESLINQKTQLEEQIRGLQGKGQLPVEVMQRQDSYISHPASQVDQNVHVQDQYEMEVNNDDHVYNNHRCPDYWHIEGAVDAFDGFRLDELLLPPDDEMITNGRIALNEPAIEHPESSQSGLCPAKVVKIKLDMFLIKLHPEVRSNVDPSGWTGLLEEEQRRFGRFSFPSSLIPTVERIKDAYGDVSATCLISPTVSEKSYIFFCAMIRDMEHLRLDQVTEDIMLNWGDVIKDALGLGFNVAFAMEHLKKVACAFFGQSGCKWLNDVDSKISTLEAEVNYWKKKRAEIYEESKMSIDAVESFKGVPISTGLFP